MTDALERLVNLALFLATASEPVTADRIRSEVAGYPPGQDEAAFLRMFERDKDDLRAAGLALQVAKRDEVEAYRLDPKGTYSAEIVLSAGEVAAIRAVGAALVDDPAFPYGEDLRLALAKTMPSLACRSAARARIADEAPEAQGAATAALTTALETRKRATFGYTNSLGEQREHVVEPHGLFLREGRWYLVSRDVDLDSMRVHAVMRMSGLTINALKPKSPDFERLEGFDVRRWIGLPFQYGETGFEATVRFSADCAWRAPLLSAGSGSLSDMPDGSVVWTVTARDVDRLARWIVENGPGIALEGPVEACETLRAGLAEAVAAHDG